jgi:hypothetical protein
VQQVLQACVPVAPWDKIRLNGKKTQNRAFFSDKSGVVVTVCKLIQKSGVTVKGRNRSEFPNVFPKKIEIEINFTRGGVCFCTVSFV